MKKRILLVNDFLYSGGAETVFRLTSELLSASDKFKTRNFFATENHSYPKNIFSYLFSFNYKNKLEKELLEFKPDIIHFHGYYHVLSPSVFIAIKNFKKRNRCKVIYTAHDYNFLHPNSSMLEYSNGVPKNSDLNSLIKTILFKRIDHRGFKFSLAKKIHWLISHRLLNIKNQIDLFISPSYFLANLYENKLKKSISVVRNPLNVTPVSENTKNFSETKLKFIYFGRLSREKGLLEFLNLINQNDIERFELDIFGKGDLVEELGLKIKQRKIEDVVFLKGYLSYAEILKELSKYNAMIIPSLWYENAPMSIIEASSKGLIVVGSNHGGIKEIAERYSNSVLFEFKNISLDDIIEKTKKILSENTRTKSFSDLSPEFYIKKLKEIYS